MQTLIINFIKIEHFILSNTKQYLSGGWGAGCWVISIYECRRELEVVHNEKADTSFIYGTYDTVLIAYYAITLRL